jgi:hypothetical protein
MTILKFKTRSNTPTLSPGGVQTDEASSHFTGIILLFSAGTFLYIATVHVLPELIVSHFPRKIAYLSISI